MPKLTRRDFAKRAGAAGVGILTSSAAVPFAYAQARPKVVIVGGGAGGATVAHYIKRDAPNIDVTLIEANPRYSSSFFSNLYIGGFRSLRASLMATADCAPSASAWSTTVPPMSIRPRRP